MNRYRLSVIFLMCASVFFTGAPLAAAAGSLVDAASAGVGAQSKSVMGWLASYGLRNYYRDAVSLAGGLLWVKQVCSYSDIDPRLSSTDRKKEIAFYFMLHEVTCGIIAGLGLGAKYQIGNGDGIVDLGFVWEVLIRVGIVSGVACLGQFAYRLDSERVREWNILINEQIEQTRRADRARNSANRFLNEERTELATTRRQLTSACDDARRERDRAANFERALVGERDRAANLERDLAGERDRAANLERDLAVEKEASDINRHQLDAVERALVAEKSHAAGEVRSLVAEKIHAARQLKLGLLGQRGEEKDCSICWKEINLQNIVHLHCGHEGVCKTCYQATIEVAFKEKNIENMKCSHPGCKKEFTKQDIAAIYAHSPEEYCDLLIGDESEVPTGSSSGASSSAGTSAGTSAGGSLQQRVKRFFESKSDLELQLCLDKIGAGHCPTPDCTYRFAKEEGDAPQIITCEICNCSFCTHCPLQHTEHMTCQEAKAAENPDEAELASRSAIESTAKRCPSCHVAVERIDGCNHIECKCTKHFCYRCNKALEEPYYDHPNNRLVCECPIFSAPGT